MSLQTTLEVTENVTQVSSTGDTITINLTDDVTEIQAYTLAIPFEVPGQITAANVTVVPYNTIASDNLADALKELADQDFRSAEAPTGSTVDGTSTLAEGDTWYDTDDNQFKIYREVSSNVYSWVPLVVGTTDSDTLDGGSY
jgi:hypothetical protein